MGISHGMQRMRDRVLSELPVGYRGSEADLHTDIVMLHHLG